MRALVTGGLGFIGSFVSERLVAEGYEVTIYDDRRANVLETIPGVDRYIIATVGAKPISAYGFDLIVHTASPVGSVGVLGYAGRIASEIAASTRTVVDAAISSGCPLVNISTSEVYGFSGVYRETDACIVEPGYNARREYGVGKLAAEFIVGNACKAEGLRALTIRPFNVAGPRQTREKGFVLPTFVEQALANEPLTVYGDGNQERSFTAVTDVVEFIMQALPAQHLWDGSPINVGTAGNRTSINGLARKVIELTGSRSEIVHVDPTAIHGPDYAEADGVVKVPKTVRAHRLGWQPRVMLDELVRMTAAEYRALKAAA